MHEIISVPVVNNTLPCAFAEILNSHTDSKEGRHAYDQSEAALLFIREIYNGQESTLHKVHRRALTLSQSRNGNYRVKIETKFIGTYKRTWGGLKERSTRYEVSTKSLSVLGNLKRWPSCFIYTGQGSPSRRIERVTYETEIKISHLLRMSTFFEKLNGFLRESEIKILSFLRETMATYISSLLLSKNLIDWLLDFFNDLCHLLQRLPFP